MKAILFGKDRVSLDRVYSREIREKIASVHTLYPEPLDKTAFEARPEILREAEILFTTWGMETFTEAEIKIWFPNLKHIFYAAGSVQGFARAFLNCGVRVYSAWQANAVPVAEYTHAQIVLALKGYYTARRMAKWQYRRAQRFSNDCGGAFGATVGIIGAGVIGSMVAERLRQNDVRVLCYDPFLSEERASELGLRKASLEEIFEVCDVITNHLADKDELAGVLNGELFERMKPYATFINTGRGRQVDEKALYKAMKKVKTRTALLDVTFPEPKSPFHFFHRAKNIFLTPHIAGSLGKEVERMAEYMLSESLRIQNGEAPLYEVTIEKLAHMA